MTMTPSERAFCKRFTCLLIVLVMMLCLVPDFSPKAQAFLQFVIPVVGWTIAEVAAALGISVTAAGGMYVLMEALDRGSTGLNSTVPYTDFDLSGRMSKSNMIFNELSAELQAKIIASAERFVDGETAFDFDGKDMREFADASNAAVPFVPDTGGLYKYSGWTVRQYMEKYVPTLSDIKWKYCRVLPISQNGYYDFTYYKVNTMEKVRLSGYSPPKLDGTLCKGVYLVYFTSGGWSDLYADYSGAVDSLGNTYVDWFENRITNLFIEQYDWISPPQTATKAANAIDWTGVDAVEKFRVRTPPFNPTLPPEQAAAEGIRAVGTMPYADVVAKADVANPSLPETDEEKSVSNWEWWDKLQEMLRSTWLSGQFLNGLRDALEELERRLKNTDVLTSEQRKALEEQLKKVEAAKKSGAITQQEADTLTQQLTETMDAVLPSPPAPEPEPETGGGKKKIDFKKLIAGWSGLYKVFPFSLPWDLVGFIDALKAPRETPKIEIVLPKVMFNSKFTADLSAFDGVAAMIRNFVLGLFVLGLILVTSKLIKW